MLTCYSEIQEVSALLDDLPYKPYCSNDLKTGLLIRPRSVAIGQKYIELNPPHVKKFLTFDLDYPSWPYVADDVFLPQPLWYVENRENGHSHLIYVLRTPVFTTSAAHLKPLKYLNAIVDAYSERLNADPMYSGLISKNPWSDKWRVVQTGDMIYDLDFLADAVWRELSRKPTKKPVENVAGLGRNCWIFEHVRVWSYRAIRKFWGGKGYSGNLAGWEEAVEYKCLEENAKFFYPLEGREIKQIVKSISSWTWRRLNAKGFSEWQRKNINRRWDKESKKAQGIAMLKDGYSVEDVILKLNVSQATVYNWLKEASPDDVKRTLTALKPWEAQGISRRMWYYMRGKNQ